MADDGRVWAIGAVAALIGAVAVRENVKRGSFDVLSAIDAAAADGSPDPQEVADRSGLLVRANGQIYAPRISP